MEVLDKVLEDPVFIRYTYNSLLERLWNLEWEEGRDIHNKMIRKLTLSKEMKTFLSEKLEGRRLGVLRKIDYHAFYERLYGKNSKITSVILDDAKKVFKTTPSNSDEEIDYKLTLLYSLSGHGYLTGEKGMDLLLQVMKDKSDGMRGSALRELANFGEKAFPFIEDAVRKDSSEHVRANAIWLAGDIGGERVFPLIQEALEKDTSERVRLQAVWLTTKFGEKAFPLLEKVVKTDSSEHVRGAAVMAVGNMGEKAWPIVQKALKDPKPYMRASGVKSAGRMGKLSAVQEALSDPSEQVRVSVADTIVDVAERMGGEKTLLTLQKLLEDTSQNVRAQAISSAGEIGESTLPILKEALNNPNLSGEEKEEIKYIIEWYEQERSQK